VTGPRVARLIALGLVILLVVWIARHTYWEETTVPLPPKGEAARNPLYAAQKFVEALGGRVEKDHTFVTPPVDHVMVLTDWNWNLSAVRRQLVERWVESGGRLVVDRSVVSGSDDFERWSGIGYRQRHKTESAEPDEEGGPQRPPQLSVLLAARCTTLEEEGSVTLSPTRSEYSVCSRDPVRTLTSGRRMQWVLRNDEGVYVMRVKVGRGSVTDINGWPFRYRGFFDGDHAALFAAATQFRRGDVVHFLSEQDSGSLLDLAWRYGAPVVLLGCALIALALWRGSVRFGPLAAPEQSARRSLAEQIRGTGRFALRFGGGQALHAAEVRALGEAARRRIRGYENLSSEERSAAVARLSGFEADRLSAAINYTGSRRSHELRGVIALLEAARRRILIENQRSRHGNRS
jgi:hypothetical protein